MIIDGRAIAKGILEDVRARLTKPVLVRAITVAPTPATLSYLSIKKKAAEQAGMTLEVVQLADDAEIDKVVEAVEAPGAAAVIVQLPLPEHLDEEYILTRIPLGKDADVLSPLAREESDLLPPVVAAVREIVERSGIDVAGKKAVVIGEGWLVGEPVAAWLKQQGTEVVVLNEETFIENREALSVADMVVSGAGSPHLITPDMVKDGVVLIDAGTSEQEGSLVGDIDPACAQKASVYTPVPGGVGPIAVACLFKNAYALVH